MTLTDILENYIQDFNGCWRWCSSIRTTGHGQVTYNNKNKLAHRIFYEHHVREIPNGGTLTHACKINDCVNPDHLTLYDTNKYLDLKKSRFLTNYSIDHNGCWIWKSYLRGGYGNIKIGGKRTGAHRFFYENFKGEIPLGLHIDHLCRVPSCVNPDHLEAVTPKENTLRGVGPSAINAKKTHCKRGHSLHRDNVRVYDNQRACLLCSREQRRIRYLTYGE